MKGNKTILGFWLMVTIGIMMSSCTKVNNNETIVLIGRESYIPDIDEFFSKDDVCKVAFDSVKKNLSIKYGSIPPKIDSLGGKYIVDPTFLIKSMILISSSDGHTSNATYTSDTIAMPEVYICFERQHNGIVSVEFKESSISVITDTAYIMGNGDDCSFTVYFPEKREFDQLYNGTTCHVTMERDVIMSGYVTPEGLSDFGFASIVTDMKVEPRGILPLYDKGTYMIYWDADGCAEKCDW